MLAAIASDTNWYNSFRLLLDSPFAYKRFGMCMSERRALISAVCEI